MNDAISEPAGLQGTGQQLSVTQGSITEPDEEFESGTNLDVIPGRVVKHLGKGIGGTVYAIEWQGTTAACKEITCANAVAQAKRELKVWKALNEENPPSQDHHWPQHCILQEVSKQDHEGSGKTIHHVFVIMWPIADSNSLMQCLRSPTFPRRSIRYNMGCMIVGLAIIHAAGVWHHDIHWGNILMHDNHPLYTDFGKAHKFDQKADWSPFDGWKFVFPDVCKEHNAGDKEDVFSLAAILLDMLAYLTRNEELKSYRVRPDGRPINFSWSAELLKREPNEKVINTLKTLTSPNPRTDYIKVILEMLDRDRETRPTAKESALKWWKATNKDRFRDHKGSKLKEVIVGGKDAAEKLRLQGGKLRSEGGFESEREVDTKGEHGPPLGQNDPAQAYVSDEEDVSEDYNDHEDRDFGPVKGRPAMCRFCDMWCKLRFRRRDELPPDVREYLEELGSERNLNS
jgi:Protein kinase domain